MIKIQYSSFFVFITISLLQNLLEKNFSLHQINITEAYNSLLIFTLRITRKTSRCSWKILLIGVLEILPSFRFIFAFLLRSEVFLGDSTYRCLVFTFVFSEFFFFKFNSICMVFIRFHNENSISSLYI